VVHIPSTTVDFIDPVGSNKQESEMATSKWR